MAIINARMGSSPNSVASGQARSNAGNGLANDVVMTPDPFWDRKPDYYVGIFNVSPKQRKFSRPWGLSRDQQSGESIVIIEGRAAEDLWSKPYILKDKNPQHQLNPSTQEIHLTYQNGTFLAQDLLNCNDPWGDWKTARPVTPNMGNEGNNYYEQGLFWCKLKTPTSDPDLDAVESAIKRLEAHYEKLLGDANQMWVGGPEKQKEIADGHHEAAEYFLATNPELEFPWHTTMTGGMMARLKSRKKAAEAPVVAPVAKAVAPAPPVAKAPESV